MSETKTVPNEKRDFTKLRSKINISDSTWTYICKYMKCYTDEDIIRCVDKAVDLKNIPPRYINAIGYFIDNNKLDMLYKLCINKNRAKLIQAVKDLIFAFNVDGDYAIDRLDEYNFTDSKAYIAYVLIMLYNDYYWGNHIEFNCIHLAEFLNNSISSSIYRYVVAKINIIKHDSRSMKDKLEWLMRVIDVTDIIKSANIKAEFDYDKECKNDSIKSSKEYKTYINAGYSKKIAYLLCSFTETAVSNLRKCKLINTSMNEYQIYQIFIAYNYGVKPSYIKSFASSKINDEVMELCRKMIIRNIDVDYISKMDKIDTKEKAFAFILINRFVQTHPYVFYSRHNVNIFNLDVEDYVLTRVNNDPALVNAINSVYYDTFMNSFVDYSFLLDSDFEILMTRVL